MVGVTLNVKPFGIGELAFIEVVGQGNRDHAISLAQLLAPKLDISRHSPPVDDAVWTHSSGWHSAQDLFYGTGREFGLSSQALKLFWMLVEAENRIA